MKTLKELGYRKASEDNNILIYRRGRMVLTIDTHNLYVMKAAMIGNNLGVGYTYDELKAIVAILEGKK